MRTINLLNEDGNVRVSVRKELTKQCEAKVQSALKESGLDVLNTKRGTVAIELGKDQNETPIYYEISGTVTRLPLDKENKKRSTSKKTKNTVDVPELF